MEENSIITGQIPVTGSGVHKTYEESIIRVFNNLNIRAYNNEYFVNDEGSVTWAENLDQYKDITEKCKDGIYTKIEILNILGMGDRVIVEFIDSKILRQHLIAEAIMRHQENEKAHDTEINSNFGISKTYPESKFRIIESFHYRYVLERPNSGTFIRKSDGNFIIPSSTEEYERAKKERRSFNFNYNYYVSLDYIHNHPDEFEEVEIVKTYPSKEKTNYFVEIINKDVYQKYMSFNRKLTI